MIHDRAGIRHAACLMLVKGTVEVSVICGVIRPLQHYDYIWQVDWSIVYSQTLYFTVDVIEDWAEIGNVSCNGTGEEYIIRDTGEGHKINKGVMECGLFLGHTHFVDLEQGQ